MVLGWRRAFCTSIPRDRDHPPKQLDQQQQSTNSTPKSASKFGFFSSSNPSTPRMKSEPDSNGPNLRCRTAAVTVNPTDSVPPESPKLHCKTTSSRFFLRSSNPSSPRSPSTFSLIKSSLRLSKQSRCGICLQSVRTGQGMAIFTAECSHSFHFPCIAGHVKKQGSLSCPVCRSLWKELPVLSLHNNQRQHQQQSVGDNKREKLSPRTPAKQRPDLKVYNDDEPLTSPTTGARFNPIPESDENLDEDSVEFQGFFVNGGGYSNPVGTSSGNIEVRLLPEAAIVSVGRSYEAYAIVLKIKAPKALAKSERRAPIDLVTVLDVGGSMTNEKLQMMKRAMRLIVSFLSASDRLSIVAFSSTSKRLLPLRRMTTSGRRSARRIVDAIAVLDGTSSAGDALKKAAKVLEDRRERNSVASIMLLSEGSEINYSVNQRRQLSFVSSTRLMEIPVHSIDLSIGGADEGIAKCVEGLLRIVVQDLRLQLGFVSGSAPGEIAAVYSYNSRPVALGNSTVRVEELYAEEERELLVELKVPSSAIGAHHVLSVRCCHRDPSTQEVVYGKEQALLVPRPHAVRSSAPSIQRLKYLFVATRAMAESRRLADRGDLTGAHHMLASARVVLSQSTSASADEYMVSLEAELLELQRKRQSSQQMHQQQIPRREVAAAYMDEKGEPLTPTSAWRAAERLARVAIMRKSLNRVSDLHGFEDARF